jgi:hypothetical protein
LNNNYDQSPDQTKKIFWARSTSTTYHTISQIK